MQHRRNAFRHLVAPLLLLPLIGACGTTGSSQQSQPINSGGLIDTLTPPIEALYLSWRELDEVHKDIKSLEQGFLFDPDARQLGHIQKIALYLQDASLRIHHQWERLSVIHYIRPEMMRDYVTLSVNGLTTARDAVGYDRMFMQIYAAGVQNEAVLADLKRASALIDKNVAAMQKIVERLRPIANPPWPATVSGGV